jgi:hypothetical protein
MRSLCFILLSMLVLPAIALGSLYYFGDSSSVNQEYCNGIDDDADGMIDEGFFVGEPCNSTPNYCGDTNIGVFECGGIYAVCNAPAPPQRPEWNKYCVSMSNVCGQVNYGFTGCDGVCLAQPPIPYDFDKDGIVDCLDNCVLKYNPDQNDTDNDGIGDLCESADGYTPDYFTTVKTTPRYNITPSDTNQTDGNETLPPDGDGDGDGNETLPPNGDGDGNETIPPDGDGDGDGNETLPPNGDGDDDDTDGNGKDGDDGLDTDGDGDGNQTSPDGDGFFDGHGPFDPEQELVRKRLIRHYDAPDNTSFTEGVVYPPENETDAPTVTIEDIAESDRPFQPMLLLLGVLAVFILILFVLYFRSTND